MKKFLIVLYLLIPWAARAASVQATDLRCEHLKEPLGIDVTVPRLSWCMDDPVHTRGRKQSAYRVLVASNKQQLEKDTGDLWDSGKVTSHQSHLIPYAGKPLVSHTDCHWKVKLWTEDGSETPWSVASRFTIGLLEASDWQGPWMTYGEDPETKQPVSPEKHLWFRRNVELLQIPASAIIHIASIGYHELYVNGSKVDDRVLAPTLTRLDKRVHYVSYDITHLLRSGSNCIGIHYGPGWARYDFFKTSPVIRVQLQATMADGQVVRLSSGKDWRYRVAASENTGKWQWGNNGGERMDARRHVPDWNVPGYEDSTWANAVESNRKVILSAEMVPPSQIIAGIPAIEVKEAGKAANGSPIYEVLLEKNFTGFLRVKMRGQTSGDRIRITIADAPSVDSVFNQVSEFICAGGGEEVFENRFNYCAGRYLTIQGMIQKPRIEDISGLAVSNALERVGSFNCSNELFNRIYETDLWTFLANTTEGYTADCPHRERMGYGEVAFATAWGIGLPNFQTGAFYNKWIRDWADVQEESGWIHHTAPQINQHYGGVMWSSAGINVSAETYLHHGDLRALEANHASAKRWLDFLHQNVQEDLLTPYNKHWGKFLGDWAAPGGRNERGDSPEAKYFNNCVYAKNLADFIQHSKLLGKEEGLTVYEQRLERLRVRIHEEFYRPETATCCNGTQVQQAFALLVGVCPTEQRDKVRGKLFHDIGQFGYFDMGSSGLPVLLKYMIEQSGRSELLAGPLNRTIMPSYGFFQASGQTTWPEHWQPRTSNIHTCYTGIASWFIKSLAGIRPDPAHPGFQKFLIQPVLVDGLTHVRAETKSPYGMIVSEWRRKGDVLQLEVEIPPNSSATVSVPTGDTEALRKKVSAMEGITYLRAEPKHVILLLESGRYALDTLCPNGDG